MLDQHSSASCNHIVFKQYRWIQYFFMFLILLQPISSFGYMEIIQTEKPHPIKVSKQHAQFYNDHSANNLWQVLREHFSLDDYSYAPAVRAQIRWYQYHRAYFERVTNRARPYLYYIYQQVKKNHLPIELVALPMIESAYNPFAYSHAGASGLWQIMPKTANYFGIKHNYWYDGRRDITSSTKMALGYLTYLSSFFNHNWLLAIAAYDSGEGTVLNALQYNSRYGRRLNFWSLPLPQETQAYVPSLLAVVAIIKNPARYGLSLPYIPARPYLGEVTIAQSMQLAQIAKLTGIKMEHVYELNPGFNHWVTGTQGPFHLLLPIDKIEHFKLALNAYNKTRVQDHYVTKGDTLGRIALLYHRSADTIKQFNHLNSNVIRVGQKITIPPLVTLKTDPKKIEPSTTKLVANKGFYHQEHAPFVYQIQKGDSVATLAKKYNISARDIQHWNNLHNLKQLVAGKKLLIWPGNQLPNSKLAYYKVKHGDNLSSIAKKHRVTLAQLCKWNNLKPNAQIKVGQQIKVG